jgi:hypothetical protein
MISPNPIPRIAGALLILACLFIAPAIRAATNSVSFDLGNFGADAAAYKQVRIAPSRVTFPRAEGPVVRGIDYGFRTTDALGRFTNDMVTGTYDITFTNRFLATTFQITVPDTNYSGVLTAAELTTSGTNSPSNLAAYSQAAANAIFQRTLQLSTNGTKLASGFTNINFTTGVTGYVSGATAFLGVTASGSGSSAPSFDSTAGSGFDSQ